MDSSLGEEEMLLQMVQDFIESSEPSSVASTNFSSIKGKKSHLKPSIFNLQEILRKKTDVEMEVSEKIGEYMKGKMEMKKTTSLKKWLVMCLRLDGFDASLCRTSWVTKPGCPCGNYEYIDIIFPSEQEEGVFPQSRTTRLLIDIDFKSQFEVARPTQTYSQLSNTLPSIFVGDEDKLNKVINILCSAVETSLKESGLHIPPWRRVNYMQSKWLSNCCKKDKDEPSNNNFDSRSTTSSSETKPCFCSINGDAREGVKLFGKWVPPAVGMKVLPKRKDIGGGGGGCGLLSSQFSKRSINCC